MHVRKMSGRIITKLLTLVLSGGMRAIYIRNSAEENETMRSTQSNDSYYIRVGLLTCFCVSYNY